MGVFVKAEHILESTTVGRQKPRVAFCSNCIFHGPEMLVRQVLQVEGQVRWPIDGEIRTDAPTMLRNGSDEQAHWSRNSMALEGPLAPGSGATGRGRGPCVALCC